MEDRPAGALAFSVFSSGTDSLTLSMLLSLASLYLLLLQCLLVLRFLVGDYSRIVFLVFHASSFRRNPQEPSFRTVFGLIVHSTLRALLC